MSEPGARGSGGSEHPPGLWPVPGDGVLARHGDLILLASIESGQIVDVLLDLLEQTAAAGGDGRQFTDAVADAIEADLAAHPPGSEVPGQSVLAFGSYGAGLTLTVSGGAWADVMTEHGTARLEAAQPGMLVRGQFRAPVGGIRGGLGRSDDGMARTDRFSRLDGGTVRAGGLAYYVGTPRPGGAAAWAAAVPVPAAPARPPEPVLPEPVLPAPAVPEPAVPEPAVPEPVVPAPAPAPVAHMPTEAWPTPAGDHGQGGFPVSPQAQPDAERAMTMPPVQVPPVPVAVLPSEPFESVLLFGSGAAADVDVPQRSPLSKVRDLPPGTSSYVSDSPIIQGVYCKNGHFDDPEALFCAVCGISMNQQTLVPRPGTRPPLGVLVLDDGAVFQLDSDYVVGREPSLDSSVASGKARPLRITDDSGIVSRVHARIHLEGWRVLVTDLGSANGTRVKLPRQPTDQALAPQMPMVLATGSQVDLGGRGFRYESHRGR